MRNRILWLFISCLWMTTSTFAQDNIASDAEKISDVRVLIDMSGSMKKNDPDNLRVPALRLITQLIPEGQQAGVWSFGQYVNMLVKHGKVDAAWKDKAYEVAKQINSKGLYTNIEDVLEKATWDWKKPDDKTNRNLILLTDGVVDISKDPKANAESRRRIINETLPRLKEAGVTVHTVALSDDADKPFLRQMSSVTEGWNEIAKDASKLERIFLKLFEKSVPVETLPMTDNRVLVDDSIRELTMLIFRKEGANTATLKSPSGEEFTYRSKQEKMRWRHEERYDLITIDEPMAGEWYVDAELDPDNRVMVVTDLKVRASRLPNVMMTEDVMSYYVELAQDGEVIRKPEFLDFVHISLERSGKGEHQKSIPVKDDGDSPDKRARDGRFSTKVGGQLTPGEYEYEMQVDGMTFKRSKRDTVRVVDKPIAVTVKEEKPGDPAEYSLTLTPFAELIKAESVLLDATVTKQGGVTTAVNIPRSGPSEWRLTMKVNAGDIYDVKISMQAERHDGRQGEYDLGDFQLGSGSVDVAFDKSDEPPADIEKVIEPPKIVVEPDVKPEPEAAHEDEVEAKPEEESKPEPEPESEEDSHEDEESDEAAEDDHEGDEESPNWIMVAVKILGLNGVLFGIGFFVYRKWFRTPKDKNDEDESAEDEAEDDD